MLFFAVLFVSISWRETCLQQHFVTTLPLFVDNIFPYIVIVGSVISIAVHFALKLDQVSIDGRVLHYCCTYELQCTPCCSL